MYSQYITRISTRIHKISNLEKVYKSKIPKILIITQVELGDKKNPTMLYMDKLINNYVGKIIWFSICKIKNWESDTYDFPSAYHPPIDKFSRIPLIKFIIKYTIGEKYLILLASRFAKKHNAEVVFSDISSEVLSISRKVAKKVNLPLVSSIQDDPIARIKSKNYPKFISNHINNEFKKTLAFSKSCGVISDYMAEYYRIKYKINSIQTLYIGTEKRKCLHPRLSLKSKREIIIGSLGTVHSFDNFENLVKTVKYLNGIYKDKYFSIRHIGDLPSKYLSLEYVDITGWLSYDEVFKELSLIDIGLLSVPFESSKKVTLMTSFPTKVHNLLEAQVPLLGIGPDYSAIVKFIRDFSCGQVCNDISIQSISSTIDNIINDENSYEKTKTGLIKAAKHFSRENFYRNFELLFEGI